MEPREFFDSFLKEQEGGMLFPTIQIGYHGLVALGIERSVREEMEPNLLFELNGTLDQDSGCECSGGLGLNSEGAHIWDMQVRGRVERCGGVGK